MPYFVNSNSCVSKRVCAFMSECVHVCMLCVCVCLCVHVCMCARTRAAALSKTSITQTHELPIHSQHTTLKTHAPFLPPLLHPPHPLLLPSLLLSCPAALVLSYHASSLLHPFAPAVLWPTCVCVCVCGVRNHYELLCAVKISLTRHCHSANKEKQPLQRLQTHTHTPGLSLNGQLQGSCTRTLVQLIVVATSLCSRIHINT